MTSILFSAMPAFWQLSRHGFMGGGDDAGEDEYEGRSIVSLK